MSEKIDEQKEQEEKLDASCGEPFDLAQDKLGRTTQTKKPFTSPKLTFIEPKLTKHGNITKVTSQNGFFGEFSP